jgi:hypothetical protein
VSFWYLGYGIWEVAALSCVGRECISMNDSSSCHFFLFACSSEFRGVSGRTEAFLSQYRPVLIEYSVGSACYVIAASYRMTGSRKMIYIQELTLQ